jgi:hypothetical protein
MGGRSVMAVRKSIPCWVRMAIRHAARHYTLWGKLHKGNRSRSLQAELAGSPKSGASQKQILEMKISNYHERRACV